MTHPSYLTQPDEALRRVLTQPSYAAQILTVAARVLDMSPAAAVTKAAALHAFDIGVATITATLARPVRDEAVQRAYSALPGHVDHSRGAYAIRLRDTAASL